VNPRFHRSAIARTITLAAVAAVGLTGCNREPSEAATAPKLPHPDLCQTLDRKLVETALLGKVTACEDAGTGKDGYSTQFTSALNAHPAYLLISYAERIDLRSGDDRWAEEPIHGSRVALLGIGDQASFNPKATPGAQLMVLKGDRVLSVGLQITDAPVPQDQLPDHLMDVAGEVLTQLRK
jgi:hypothetical protein